jgi:hypothetical protein
MREAARFLRRVQQDVVATGAPITEDSLFKIRRSYREEAVRVGLAEIPGARHVTKQTALGGKSVVHHVLAISNKDS